MKDVLWFFIIGLCIIAVLMVILVSANESNANNQFLEALILYPEAKPQLKSNWLDLHYCAVKIETIYGTAIVKCDDYKEALIRGLGK